MINTDLINSLIAAMGAFILFFFLIIIAILVFCIIIKWKLFEKAGKPGWAAIVPIYSDIVLLDIIGYNWYYIFVYCLLYIPFIGELAILLFGLTKNVKLAKSFGKEVGFGIGLAFLNPIFIAIIVFDNSITYKGQTVNGNIDFNDLF